MTETNKNKFKVTLVLVLIVAFIGFRMYQGQIRYGECPSDESWDANKQECIPDKIIICEARGGYWDYTNDICVPKEEDPHACPTGYIEDINGVCQPIMTTPRLTYPTETETVPEFPNFLIMVLMIVCGGFLIWLRNKQN